RRDADIAGHGKFQANSHCIFFEHAYDWLQATLRRGNIPREVGHAVALDLRKGFDVATGGIHAVFSANDDDAHVSIMAECLQDSGNLTAPAIGHDIQWRSIEPKKSNFLLRMDFVVHAIEIPQDCCALVGVILAHAPPRRDLKWSPVVLARTAVTRL